MMDYTQFTRGSEWRRWDLHIHSPFSVLNNGFGSDWDNYVKELFRRAIAKNISAIGITDYFTIQGYKKLKTYLDDDAKLSKLFTANEINKIKQILVLPNVEFRLNRFVDKSRVNFHVIFSDFITIDDIEESFLHELEFVYQAGPQSEDEKKKLKINNLEVLGKQLREQHAEFRDRSDLYIGMMNAVVDDEQITRILSNKKSIFRDKYLIAIPADEDLSKVSWNGQDHQARKLLIQKSDVIFSSNLKTIKWGLGKKHDEVKSFVKEFKSLKPCLTGSDAHCYDELFANNQNKITWIKADLTFEGLKQIIYEPEERVRIQHENPAFDFQKSYFSEIEISESMDVIEGQELKFEANNIRLNPNLVTIIGGRGSGKSILVNYFANGFRKFDASSEKIAFKKTDSFKVKWRNSLLEDEEIFQFDKQHDLQFLFISQSEVKEKVKSPRDFGEEIKAILELDDLKFSREIEDDLQKRLSSYNQIDSWFKIKDEYGNLINDKEYIQSEIRKNSEFLKRITTKENKAKLEKYSNNIVTIQKLSEDHNDYLALYNDLMEFQEVTNERIKTLNNTIPEINFEIQLNVINQNLDRIKSELDSAQLENTEIKKEFKDYKGDLANLLASVEKFKSTMASLEKRLKEISENEQKRINELNRKNEISDLIRKELERQESLINSQWEKLLQGKAGWNDRQKELMKRIINDRNIEVKGKIIFNHEHFYELISEYVDGRKIKNKNRNYELKERIGIKDFFSFIECLHDIDSLKSRFEIILLNEFSSIEKILYDLSIRSEYLYVQPEITYNGKNLKNISVGQRGTIYLCLKLATNIFSQTIIFDQPEDDLDNEFIFNDLINIFKEIKLYRQVIIVTHNANIVVNADAEQVIVAQNTNEKLSYVSGSLENPDINKEVCRILEGGEDAFNRRSNKYIGI